MIKIGSEKIDTNIFLAPLAGCSDLAFRLIAREHGAKFCFYEMVDANALHYNPEQVDSLLTHKKDKPIAAQLIGSDPDMMLSSAKKLLDMVDVKFLDINAACPVRKMVIKRSGSYLMKEPDILYDIIRNLAKSLSVPVTVKMRVGYSKIDLKELEKIAKNCEKVGASALFVHGRTRSQENTGPVDYNAIKTVKDSVKIPVFGSGNVMTPGLAKKMFDETDCDGIIVAKGAFGNPWIFKNIEEIMSGKPVNEVDLDTRINVLKKHLGYVVKFKEDDQTGFMRKIALWYLKSFPNATYVRGEINETQNYEDLLKVIDSVKVK